MKPRGFKCYVFSQQIPYKFHLNLNSCLFWPGLHFWTSCKLLSRHPRSLLEDWLCSRLCLPARHDHHTVHTVVVDIGIGIIGVVGVHIHIVEVVVVVVDIVVHIDHQRHHSGYKVDEVECIGASQDSRHILTCSDFFLLLLNGGEAAGLSGGAAAAEDLVSVGAEHCVQPPLQHGSQPRLCAGGQGGSGGGRHVGQEEDWEESSRVHRVHHPQPHWRQDTGNTAVVSAGSQLSHVSSPSRQTDDVWVNCSQDYTKADTFKFYLHFAGKIKNFHSWLLNVWQLILYAVCHKIR